MKRFSILSLAVLGAASGVSPMAVKAAPRVESDSSRRLTIRVYDYAGVSEKTLARAFHETENIYGKTGIAVTMMRCRVAVTDPVLDPRCGEVPGSSVIQVRVLPEWMAATTHGDKRVFGFAATASKPDFGVIANVFHERVEELAADSDINPGVVLGHVIAHEAGHLLLGLNGHSRRGIMHIPWNEPEMAAAHMGSLIFTRDQTTKIRRDVSARVIAERANREPAPLLAENQPETVTRPGL